MQPSPDPITVRTSRLNSELTKSGAKSKILSRDAVFDALQVLYDECSSEHLKKTDPNVAEFVKKYDIPFRDIRTTRVNLTDFEIIKMIGNGHFGRVDVVKERQTGDVYAMKFMRKFDSGIKKLSYAEERDILAHSKSVWLTKLQYSFQDSVTLYLVMEFNPGGDLAGMLIREGGFLLQPAAVFYVAETILALEALHSMGYVHRDVKPDNLLIDRCGHVKLADFGSAAKLNENKLVNHGPPVGTTEYIAPEVLLHMDDSRSKGYGTSCDFWGVGVVAYELTIGQTPFHGPNVSATYGKIMQHVKYLKFPTDHGLSANYITLIRGLLCDREQRLGLDRLKSHPVFKSINFDQIRDTVPPFVPNLSSNIDCSYFKDIPQRKKSPCLENLRRRPHFSGRNLPFIGFSYTPDPIESEFQPKEVQRDDMTQISKADLEKMTLQLANCQDWDEEKDTLVLQITGQANMIEHLEEQRNKLEKQLAESMSECNGVRNTLKLEREERKASEQQALLKIKHRREEWTKNEEIKTIALQSEIANLKHKIEELNITNELLQRQLAESQSQITEHRNSTVAQQKMNRRSKMEFQDLYKKTESDRLTEIERLKKALSDEVDAKTSLQHELSSMKNDILNKNTQLDSLKQKLDSKTLRINELEVKIRNMDNNISQLKVEIDTSNKEKQDINRQSSELARLNTDLKEKQRKIEKLQITNAELDIQLKLLADFRTQVSNDKMTIEGLEDDLKRSKEHEELLQKKLEEITHSNEDLKEKTLQCYRLERQLSQSKIDLRIAERNLQYAEEKAKELKIELETIQKQFDDHKKMHQTAILEMSDINNEMAQNMLKMKKTITDLQQEKAAVEVKLAKFTGEIEQLIKRLTEADSEKEKLVAMLKDLKLANDDLLSQIAIQCETNKKFERDISQKSTENENLKADIERLKNVFIVLERQEVESEEFIVKLSKQHEEELKRNEKKINSLQQELELSKIDINELKAQRFASQQQIEKLFDVRKSLEEEVASYKSQFIQYKNLACETMGKLTSCEEKVITIEAEAVELRRLVDKLTDCNQHSREEIARKTMRIQSLKEAKYQLRVQLDEYSHRIEELEKRHANFEQEYKEKMSFFQDRVHKADEKDKQQLKLIDYLQSQVENQSHKRTLKEKFFGKQKENHPPLSLAKNYKDLETENQLLKKQLTTLEGGSGSLKEKKGNSLCKSNSQHRVSKRTNLKLRMCSHCKTLMHPPSYMYSCADCDFHIHTQCLSKATSNCKPSSVTQKTVLKESVLEGWLKVPNKITECWERCYVRLGKTFVDIYKEFPIDETQLLRSFCINRPDTCTRVCLCPLASEIAVPLTDAELDNVIKVSMTPCIEAWVHENCTLLALNIEDRGLWLDAFYKVLNHDLELKSDNIIFLIEDDVFTEIVEIAPDIHLLASQKGLYARYRNKMCRVDEIGPVKQITVFHPAKLVLMLAAPDYKLVACDLDRLILIAREQCTYMDPSIKPIHLPKYCNFLKIGVSDDKHETSFAVANPTHLLIVKYKRSEFRIQRVLDTVCPVKCLLFTENSLIAGADKFYEIDLRNSQIEEFLDLSSPLFENVYSDVNAVVGISRILQGEYLVTFKKFSAFVDEYGCAMRRSGIPHEAEPLAVQYLQEYLYIVQSNGITVIKIHPISAEPSKIEITAFRYLGADRSGLYISHQLQVRHLNAKTLEREVSSSESINEFSFTSSMVQSLDGNLDSPTSPTSGKK